MIEESALWPVIWRVESACRRADIVKYGEFGFTESGNDWSTEVLESVDN